MLDAGYRNEAALLLVGTDASIRSMVEKTGDATGPINQLIDLTLLMDSAGSGDDFEPRWAWITRAIRDWTHVDFKLFAHSHAGRGLVWAGRHALALQHFKEARGIAEALPTWSVDGPARFTYLHATAQFAAQAGLWDSEFPSLRSLV